MISHDDDCSSKNSQIKLCPILLWRRKRRRLCSGKAKGGLRCGVLLEAESPDTDARTAVPPASS